MKATSVQSLHRFLSEAPLAYRTRWRVLICASFRARLKREAAEILWATYKLFCGRRERKRIDDRPGIVGDAVYDVGRSRYHWKDSWSSKHRPARAKAQ